jgi:putative tryptophan/tyrosine transport system substrate-binding protein
LAGSTIDTLGSSIQKRQDIIVASGTPSVIPARDAANQTPVVFVATLDPVATGLVASLARPGRNITGLTSISGDVIAKRLQMTRELLPKLTKIAILVRESSPTAPQYVQESQAAARNLGIELQIERERNPQDLDRIFVAVQGSSALVVADDAEFTAHRAKALFCDGHHMTSAMPALVSHSSDDHVR